MLTLPPPSLLSNKCTPLADFLRWVPPLSVLSDDHNVWFHQPESLLFSGGFQALRRCCLVYCNRAVCCQLDRVAPFLLRPLIVHLKTATTLFFLCRKACISAEVACRFSLLPYFPGSWNICGSTLTVSWCQPNFFSTPLHLKNYRYLFFISSSWFMSP